MTTPRTMAVARKLRAGSYFVSAVAFLLAALLAPFKLPLNQAVFVTVALVILAKVLQKAGNDALIDAKKADRGADAEDDVAVVLKGLGRSWKVWRNYPAERLGDIDFLISDPNGRKFTLEVKSHMGVVGRDGASLVRRIGVEDVPFERDFIRVAHAQSEFIEEKTGDRDVTPVIVFTRADLRLHSRCVDGVYVITGRELLPFLKWASKADLKQPARARARARSR